jgi:tetratricopeptide (TPR) repeat protein
MVDAAEVAIAEARVLFRAGEFRRSAELALSAAERAGMIRRGDLIADGALLEIGVPDPATAAAVERMCRDALRTIDAGDVAGRARLHGQLAVALHHREQLDEAAIEVGRAAALAAESDDPLATAAALHARQLSDLATQTPSQLLALSDEMLDAALASGSPHLEMLALTWRIDALMWRGDARRVGHEIDALDVLAARIGEPLFRWNAMFDRAGLEQAVGRFDAAEEHARQAARLLPESQRHQTGPLLVAQLMLVATDRGVAPPEIELVRAVAIGGPLIAITMTARFDLEVGDRARARATFDAVRQRIDEVDLDRRGRPTLAAAAELGVHDDVPGVALTMAIPPGMPAIVHVIAATPSVIVVLNAVVAGAIAAIVADRLLSLAIVPSLAIAALLAVGALAAQLRVITGNMRRGRTAVRSLFPTPSISDAS